MPGDLGCCKSPCLLVDGFFLISGGVFRSSEIDKSKQKRGKKKEREEHGIHFASTLLALQKML